MAHLHPSGPPAPGERNPAPAAFHADVQAAGARRQAGLLNLLRLEASLYPWAADAASLVDQALKQQAPAASPPAATVSLYDHAILFTGHRIDDPGRQQPRFPPALETAARTTIEKSLRLLLREGERAVGIAGGASGGDLIFHELYAELGLPSLLRLTLPPESYVQLSVSPAGPPWHTRFTALLDRLDPAYVETLSASHELPPWMGPPHLGAGYNIWKRTNLWLLKESLALAPRRSLLALWDGRPGDGSGGTEHLLTQAEAMGGFRIVIIPTNSL